MRPVSFALGLIVGTVFASAVVFAWTGPTSAPPSGNVAAPINVGATDQVKNAGFGVNSLAVFGNSILSGPSVTYLNFGSTVGATGYGIRDNVGTMEFKNNNGAWTGIGSASGGSQWTTSGTSIYYNGGNVGIGTASPGQKLQVAGTVYSASGGFKFPDGTTQTTASVSSSFAASYKTSTGPLGTSGSSSTSITCPTGQKVIAAYVGQNYTGQSGWNNYCNSYGGSDCIFRTSCIGASSCAYTHTQPGYVVRAYIAAVCAGN